MKEFILFVTAVVNDLHDFLMYKLNGMFGIELGDKDLHFWVMGIIGMVVFFVVYGVSKWMLKFRFGVMFLAFFIRSHL